MVGGWLPSGDDGGVGSAYLRPYRAPRGSRPEGGRLESRSLPWLLVFVVVVARVVVLGGGWVG